MDCKYLVESGKYPKENLNEEQATEVAGMEFIIGEIDTAAANLFETFDDSTQLEKMVAEIQTKAAEKIKEWLYVTECEFIVGALDENACKEPAQEGPNSAI